MGSEGASWAEVLSLSEFEFSHRSDPPDSAPSLTLPTSTPLSPSFSRSSTPCPPRVPTLLGCVFNSLPLLALTRGLTSSPHPAARPLWSQRDGQVDPAQEAL